MVAFKALSILAVALYAVPAVLAQWDGMWTQGKVPPSAILSPEPRQEFAYGGILPFVYNYTYDTTLASYPIVDVLLGRQADRSAFEVALGLNCKDNVCQNGTLTLDIDLAKWGRFLGIGTVNMYTVERMTTMLGDQSITTRRSTAMVDFRVSLEPLNGQVDRPGMMFQQW